MERRYAIKLRPIEFFTRSREDLSNLTLTRADLPYIVQSTIPEGGDCTNNAVLHPNLMLLGSAEVTILSLTCNSKACLESPHCRFGSWTENPDAVEADPTGMGHLAK